MQGKVSIGSDGMKDWKGRLNSCNLRELVPKFDSGMNLNRIRAMGRLAGSATEFS